MKRKKIPAGGTTGKDGNGQKRNSSSAPNCTPNNNHLSSLIYQASARMSRAESHGDFDAWINHFFIWQSLFSARYGLPWPGVKYG